MNRNPIHWRTKSASEDVLKYMQIHKWKDLIKGIKKETLDLRRQSVKRIHEDFPLVRFYDFHKQGKIFADKYYGCTRDYDKCKSLPDGYYFNYPYGIFIIEIENYSRVNEERISDYLKWWDFFDCIEYTALHIMTFNRYGEFQRDDLKESFNNKQSTAILKKLIDKEYYDPS